MLGAGFHDFISIEIDNCSALEAGLAASACLTSAELAALAADPEAVVYTFLEWPERETEDKDGDVEGEHSLRRINELHRIMKEALSLDQRGHTMLLCCGPMARFPRRMLHSSQVLS